MDQPEDWHGQHTGNGGNHDGADQIQDNIHRHRTAQTVRILRAETLRRDDGKAGRHAGQKSQNQEIHRTGVPHSSQCVGAQQTSHDNCVAHIVKLLENIPQQNREGVHHKKFERLALSQINSIPPFFGGNHLRAFIESTHRNGI